MLVIEQKFIKYNFTPNANKPLYIVVHDTGNFNALANAEMHYKYFNGGDRQASAHYFVDDRHIVQLVKDTDKSWHCGDGQGQFGITNGNSIGIEMCVNKDGDRAKTQTNTLDLILYLMKKYNIPFEKVVRHYDASHKNCPQILNIDGKWTGWIDFKNRLKAKLLGVTSVTKTPNPMKPNFETRKEEKPVASKTLDIYTNVPDWAKEAVKKAKEKGLLSDPNGDNTFYRLIKILDNMGLL